MAGTEELVSFEEAEQEVDETAPEQKAERKSMPTYAGIHSSGFRDFLLKPELLHAIADCGFEHPSEVQQECIPQAITGNDIICQAKSGMGKTAVFVLATLQQITPVDGVVDTLVMTHTRELAFQICKEFERFSKYLKGVKVAVLFGGLPIEDHKKLLKDTKPHIIVGTPGRIMQLVREKSLVLTNLKRFIMDECDQMLSNLDMRRDVQTVFKSTPHEKQVMMFSATLPADVRPVCKKFTRHPMEVYVDDESKLTLHGLQQYYIKLSESQKNRKLSDLLDALEFNQVVIFVNGVRRAKELNKLLKECNFPSMAVYGGLDQAERINLYNQFKEYKGRILVSTDIFGRGVDFERVNIVINYDLPEASDQYLHRVGRSGRFGTKGLAISFVANDNDQKILNDVQTRFTVEIPEMPNEIDTATYLSNA